MSSHEEATLIELLNMIIKESSMDIKGLKDLSDESTVIKILKSM